MTQNPTNPTPAQVEAQKRVDLQKFEEEIAQKAAEFPNHSKKEFTFNPVERQLLAEQDTISALAQQAKDHILNVYSLSRVSIPYSDQLKIFYSIALGRFVVFTPHAKPENSSAVSSKPSPQTEK